MMTPENAREFMEISEDIIQKGAEMFGANQNNFNQLLYNGNVYRKAGLEPIYFCNAEQTMMIVSCRETWGKKLH